MNVTPIIPEEKPTVMGVQSETGVHEAQPNLPGRQASVSDTVTQPDIEPESVSHQSSQNNQSSDESETIQLICVDEADALQVSNTMDQAWPCEFDVPLPHQNLPPDPMSAEAWTCLVSSAAKQRTEV